MMRWIRNGAILALFFLLHLSLSSIVSVHGQQLSASRSHTCTISTLGEIYCFGTVSAAGNVCKYNSCVAPNKTTIGASAVISAGQFISCAVTVSGDAWCFGLGLPAAGLNMAATPPALYTDQFHSPTLDASQQAAREGRNETIKFLNMLAPGYLFVGYIIPYLWRSQVSFIGLTTEQKLIVYYYQNEDTYGSDSNYVLQSVTEMTDHRFMVLQEHFDGGGNLITIICGLVSPINNQTADYESKAGYLLCYQYLQGRLFNPIFPAADPKTLYVTVSFGYDTDETPQVCAIDTKGDIQCWNNNADLPPIKAFGTPGVKYVAVSVGDAHLCALQSGGRVECAGANFLGESNPPSSVFSQISSGDIHGCGIVAATNAVECFGSTTLTTTGTEQISIVSIVLNHGVGVLKANGGIRVFGIGLDAVENYLPPEKDGMIFAVTGQFHSCSIDSQHVLYCFGEDLYGRLDVPTQPDGTPLAWKEAAVGFSHTCGLLMNGTMKCWGTFPDQIYSCSYCNDLISCDWTTDPNLQYLTIASGLNITCGILTNNSIHCFGCPFRTQFVSHPPPGNYSYLNIANSLYPEWTFVCAVYTGGLDVICFGSDIAQTLRFNPATAPPVQNFSSQATPPARPADWDIPNIRIKKIVAAEDHACILSDQGYVRCSGYDSYLQSSGIPKDESYLDVVVNAYGTCTLTQQYVVRCFGYAQEPKFIAKTYFQPKSVFQFDARPYQGCMPGAYSLSPGAQSALCTGLCAAGRYGNDSLQTSPQCSGPCPPGYYCPVGTSVPIPCEEYTYSPAEGSSECLSCPNNNGQQVYDSRTKCGAKNCPAGTEPKNDDCLACPIHKFSYNASIACISCAADSYAPRTGMEQCLSCRTIQGVSCPTGMPIIDAGYWGFRDEISNELMTAPCPVNYCTASVSTTTTTSSNSDSSGSDDVGSSNSTSPTTAVRVGGRRLLDASNSTTTTTVLPMYFTNRCSKNRSPADDNVLCGRCISEDYIDWYSHCLRCTKVKLNWIVLLFFAAWLYVLVLIPLSQSASTDVSIFFYFLQCAILQLNPYGMYLEWVEFFDASPQHVETQGDSDTNENNSCLAPISAAQQLLTDALAPLVFFLQLSLIMLMHYCYHCYKLRNMRANHQAELVKQRLEMSERRLNEWGDAKNVAHRHRELREHLEGKNSTKAGNNKVEPRSRKLNPSNSSDNLVASPSTDDDDGRSASLTFSPPLEFVTSKPPPSFPIHIYTRTVIAIFLFNYQQVSLASLRYLQCQHVQSSSNSLGVTDNQSWLVVASNPSIDCNSSEYHKYFPVLLAVFLLEVCFIPVLFVYFLYSHRQQILSKDSKFVQLYGTLFQGFRPSVSWWGIFVLFRRVAIVVIQLFMTLVSNEWKYLVLTEFHIVCLALQLVVSPFVLLKDNALEVFSLLSLTALSAFMNSIMLQTSFTDASALSQMNQIILSLLFVLPLLVLLIAICVSRVLLFREGQHLGLGIAAHQLKNGEFSSKWFQLASRNMHFTTNGSSSDSPTASASPAASLSSASPKLMQKMTNHGYAVVPTASPSPVPITSASSPSSFGGVKGATFSSIEEIRPEMNVGISPTRANNEASGSPSLSSSTDGQQQLIPRQSPVSKRVLSSYYPQHSGSASSLVSPTLMEAENAISPRFSPPASPRDSPLVFNSHAVALPPLITRKSLSSINAVTATSPTAIAATSPSASPLSMIGSPGPAASASLPPYLSREEKQSHFSTLSTLSATQYAARLRVKLHPAKKSSQQQHQKQDEDDSSPESTQRQLQALDQYAQQQQHTQATLFSSPQSDSSDESSDPLYN